MIFSGLLLLDLSVKCSKYVNNFGMNARRLKTSLSACVTYSIILFKPWQFCMLGVAFLKSSMAFSGRLFQLPGFISIDKSYTMFNTALNGKATPWRGDIVSVMSKTGLMTIAFVWRYIPNVPLHTLTFHRVVERLINFDQLANTKKIASELLSKKWCNQRRVILKVSLKCSFHFKYENVNSKFLVSEAKTKD